MSKMWFTNYSAMTAMLSMWSKQRNK